MTGTPSKPFYVNIGEQAVNFETEAASYYSVSGAMSSMPDFTPAFDAIKIKKHNDLGEAYKVCKGGSKHQITLPYGDIIDLRFLSHVYGGRLDQERIIQGTSGTGTFQADETISGGTSNAQGVVESVSTYDLTLKPFQQGEVMGNGSFTATVHSIKGSVMKIKNATGAFSADDVLTGVTSGAKSVVLSVSSDLLTLKVFADAEVVTGGTSSATATIDDIVYQHDLFVDALVDPKSLAYIHEQLTVGMHLLTGAKADQANIKGAAGNQVVTGDIMYKASHYEVDTTVDVEVPVSTALDPFCYTAVAFTINGVSYEDKAKAFSMGFARNHAKLDVFGSNDPVNFASDGMTTTLSFEIFKDDFVITALMTAATQFNTVVTLQRTADEDDAIITVPCVLLNEAIKDGNKALLSTIAPDVEGTPTIVIRDKIANYN